MTFPKYVYKINRMNTITLLKSEYKVLKAQATAYGRLIKSVAAESDVTSPTRSRSAILNAFKKTGKYNKSFLMSFKKGLSRSSFFSEE